MTTDALIIKGDCLNVMTGLPAASIDAIVTDPPYGLSFMGKDWDSGVPGKNFWREALRVAKPGCHLLAAGGSRTYHRLTCAIEDAGWEIRDCIIWMYGSGFPKSLDVSKAIDREAGAERKVAGIDSFRAAKLKNQIEGSVSTGGEWLHGRRCVSITAPATEAARQWQGWGTALKPAFEPFILARKPLDGTVAENVLKHGTGGINVDGCRIGTESTTTIRSGNSGANGRYGKDDRVFTRENPPGRWPANVIHDGSDEAVAVFPETGPSKAAARGLQHSGRHGGLADIGGNIKDGTNSVRGHDDNGGSAARFFYCAKASPSEREEGLEEIEPRFAMRYGEKAQGLLPQQTPSKPVAQRNHHPTVKPVDLMKYLCRLITPPGGLILDPFCGSGSTGVAAMREGFNFIGIELNNDYAEIARRRIDHERNKTPLFSNVI